MRIVLWVILALAGVLPAAQAAPTPTSIQDRQYYSLRQIASELGMKYEGAAAKVQLSDSAGNRIVVYPNKRFATLNGIQVTLDFAPVWKNSQGYLSVSDFKYLVDPVYRRAALKGKRPRTIVVDAGHGGNDKGTSGKRSSEKYLTLIYAKKLQAKLQKLGYKVIMTRNSDTTLGLERRSEIARNADADLFISVHMNWASPSTVSGVETFALTPAGAPSSSDSTPRTTWYRGNAMVGNSGALAFSVQRSIVRQLKPVDRGVKRARFVVLTGNSCPAILIECGFVSNRTEENKLHSSDYQDKFAAAIADGINRYCQRLPR